jgi:hypothetical protein
MANMSVFYEIAKHATANPSNVLAAEGGAHMYSVLLDTDTDNGNLVAIGEWLSLDLFAEEEATTFTGKIVEKMGNGNYLVLVENPGDACLVYQVPVGAEEWTNTFKKESNLYNKAGDRVRVYGLVKHDRFEVSAEGFEGTPAVGSAITGVSNKKMIVG